MKKILKLIVAGDVGAGKTSFVKAISEIEPITTDEIITEQAYLSLKGTTTVAMDFGMLTVTDDLVLHIYGTPGQKRFSFMWEVLTEGAFAVIFLADASRIESVFHTNQMIDHFQEKIAKLPYMVCVTKLDLPESLSLIDVMTMMNRQEAITFLPINANDEYQVRDALITMLSLCL